MKVIREKKLLLSIAFMAIGTSVSTNVLSMDLYVNTKTKQIYTESGPDRELIGSFEQDATPVDRNARLKIKAEDYEYIKDGRRFDLDGRRFVLNSSFRGHGLFDSQYYTLYLKPDP